MVWNYLPVLALIGSLLWIDVPFVRQQEEGCGAASVAMVMQYWKTKGHPMKTDAMAPSLIMQLLYSKADKGIRANDVDRYLKENGFKTFLFSGTTEDLRHHIQRGRPLIVALESKGQAGRLHYLVVTGIDSNEELILVNDPAERKLLKMTKKHFEDRWQATGKWTLLAVPEK